MKITALTAHRVCIPLQKASGQSRRSNSVLLRLRTRNGTIGWGECCPRDSVTGEDWTSVLRELGDWLPAIQRQDFSRWETIGEFVLAGLDAGRGPAASCALELALLDAWSREYERPLSDILPAPGTAGMHPRQFIPSDQDAQPPHKSSAAGEGNQLRIKLSQVGGLFNSGRIYAYGCKHDRPVQLSACFGETVLLSTAARLFSRSVGPLLAYPANVGAHHLQASPFAASDCISEWGVQPSNKAPRVFGWGLTAIPGIIAKYQCGGYILSGLSVPLTASQPC